jgi:hypothetical protein
VPDGSETLRTERWASRHTCDATAVYHVELRQFPTVARAFNLTRSQLDARVLGPWLRGVTVELNDHRFSPEKARLTIYEGAELQTADLGYGRGWGNATRTGREVTAELVAAAGAAAVTPAEEATTWLKGEVERLVAISPLEVREVLIAMNERYPTWRVSDRLAVAESAVWALLHERRVGMVRGEEHLSAGQWEAVVLSWETWKSADVTLVGVSAG